MSEPISVPGYWKHRLEDAISKGLIHHAIFRCPYETWIAIEDRHTQLLVDYIRPTTSIIDIGCGWGRLLSLLPRKWRGRYMGVDLCQQFIDLARENFPEHHFHLQNVRALDELIHPDDKFDLAIMISFRPMVIRNLGEEVWNQMEEQIKRVSVNQLYLEYDVTDGGTYV